MVRGLSGFVHMHENVQVKVPEYVPFKSAEEVQKLDDRNAARSEDVRQDPFCA